MTLFGRDAAASLFVLAGTLAATATAEPVKTTAGLVEGRTEADGAVRAFLGIPYAAPPVGDRRWREPQPAAPWKGVRPATAFGARCMQGRVYDDMIFRDEESEDCLYLNVWTPARSASERLPVMVWIYGGGFRAGSASEPRQDGSRLARKGVVVVSMNYRLGVFGFFAHPELSAESGRKASGNYGLMDQLAALRWVSENVAAFGGDPARVTLFGESAGSFSVSALVASPLGKGLFQRAIGESGAYAGRTELPLPTLAASEKTGAGFAAALGAGSLEALRRRPAAELLQASAEARPHFSPLVDGYVLPKDPGETYAAGEQSRVPLLAGWNADEVRAGVVLGPQRPTAKSFAEQTRARFGPAADAVLKVYPAGTDAEAVESAAALAGDTFLVYATWKWIELQRQAGAPVYRYSFDRKIPVAPGTMVNGVPATASDVGARHAGEIEYVFGALDSDPKVPWEPADRALSDAMMSYWTNFARSGDPSGPGLPAWPRFTGEGGPQVMHLDVKSEARPDVLRARYETLDAALSAAPPAPEQ
jgi:para-nitrobenzyl esterase